MIFKKYKVLTDNIVDSVSGKSLRGHKTKHQNAENLWNPADFRGFSLSPTGVSTQNHSAAQRELHAFFVNSLWLTEQNKPYFIQYNDLIE